jgi:DNA-binding HxlR family transcriptional regulator
MRHRSPKREPLDPCPVEEVLALIQSKWTARLLYLLYQGPGHFAALKRGLSGISSEVLAVRLRTLAAADLVAGRQAGRAGRVVYEVTERGRSLEPVLWCLAGWGQRELGRRGLHWSPANRSAE